MLKIIGATDKGLAREENQDSYRYRLLEEGLAYAVVCDGMGGQKAGDIASQTACKLVGKFFDRDLTPQLGESSVKSVILSAVNAANAKLYAMARENPDYQGMGTTLILVVCTPQGLHVANVGDSRAYLVSPSGQPHCVQLTRDHTVVQTMVERGELSQEEADCHPQRHYITRAVGVEPTVDVDYQFLSPSPQQAVLLCSDGLSSYLRREETPDLVCRCIARGSVQKLIDHANDAGGSDNITAVLLYCQD